MYGTGTGYDCQYGFPHCCFGVSLVRIESRIEALSESIHSLTRFISEMK